MQQSAKVLRLVERQEEKANERIIDLLKKMLTDAEAGVITGLAGISMARSGEVTYFGVGTATQYPDQSIRYLSKLAEEFIP